MASPETELKFQIRPDDLGKLKDAQAFASASKSVLKTLDSTYFDTPDLALSAHGLTLRIRKDGKTFTQTVKTASDTPGLHRRNEWEAKVKGLLPNLDALNDPEARKQFAVLDMKGLAPVFSCRVKRTIRVLDDAIEIAIDTGEIRTPQGASLPLHEVELELKNGESKALFDLALLLADEVPLRLEQKSKAARGYALITDEVVQTQKALHVVLEQDFTTEQTLEHIVRHCLSHALANEEAALQGDMPEGVHQMRVALRRLRSALGLFRPLLPADSTEELADEVKWLANELGPARDWDVFGDTLLEPVRKALPDQGGFDTLVAAAEQSRRNAYQRVHQTLTSSRYTKLLLRLSAWLETRAWRQDGFDEALMSAPIPAVAAKMLDRVWRKANKRGRHFARLNPAERHRVRIALKKLRYASEFFRCLFNDKAAKSFIKQLSAMQDQLGHLNDVATASKLMSQLHASALPDLSPPWAEAAGLLIGWHGRAVMDIEPDVVAAWKKFSEVEPFWGK